MIRMNVRNENIGNALRGNIGLFHFRQQFPPAGAEPGVDHDPFFIVFKLNDKHIDRTGVIHSYFYKPNLIAFAYANTNFFQTLFY